MRTANFLVLFALVALIAPGYHAAPTTSNTPTNKDPNAGKLDQDALIAKLNVVAAQQANNNQNAPQPTVQAHGLAIPNQLPALPGLPGPLPGPQPLPGLPGPPRGPQPQPLPGLPVTLTNQLPALPSIPGPGPQPGQPQQAPSINRKGAFRGNQPDIDNAKDTIEREKQARIDADKKIKSKRVKENNRGKRLGEFDMENMKDSEFYKNRLEAEFPPGGPNSPILLAAAPPNTVIKFKLPPIKLDKKTNKYIVGGFRVGNDKSFAQKPIGFDEWVSVGHIAKGGFGSVDLVYKEVKADPQKPQLVVGPQFGAYKTVQTEQELFREVYFMAKLKGLPHVIQLQAYIVTPPTFGMIIEVADGGSLEDWIKTKTQVLATINQKQGAEKQNELDTYRRAEYTEIQEIFIHLVDGLAEMHSREVAHRDIKPGNVLFVKGTPKYADFGTCDRLGGMTNVKRGTSPYFAPEVASLFGSDQILLDEKVDVFALGVTLFNMITKNDFIPRPPAGNGFGPIDWNDAIWSDVKTMGLIPLLQGMLAENKATRFGVASVKASMFYQRRK